MQIDKRRLGGEPLGEATRQARRLVAAKPHGVQRQDVTYPRKALAALSEEASAAGHPTRRAFLATAGGTVAALGSMLLPVSHLMPAAWAQATPDDIDLIKFAVGLELAAIETYRAALDTGKLTDPVRLVATMFSGHHQEHADALNTALGADEAVTKPNAAILREFGSPIAKAANEAAVLEIMYKVEEAAAATYLFAIGALSDVKSAGTVATILPVESEHATVLATILGKDPGDYLVEFLTTTQAVKPASFPA